ncbi:putative acyl carrier protein [Streptomyces sp. NBRC 110611]|uniref:acyl carrier protein n=1 Tax=Streptomyces sp. NBRC 110611 TaxID=1621259 RepID=UPI000858767F|nr:acyl carrier protein [Streptomyces sp. NBRC 110611]GAU71073.1 putative acyl carrier protein [Streptomyces sp. NBRC 110611]
MTDIDIAINTHVNTNTNTNTGTAGRQAPAARPEITEAELVGTVRATIADVLGTTPDAITDSTALEADHGIDSLELMAIGAQLERALGVQIVPEDLLRADTVGHAIDLLTGRKIR